jgi:hypothetical protein
VDTNQRHAQAQYEVRQTSREEAPTGWSKKARLPEEWAKGEREMTGPRPAGRPWTRTDDDELRALLDSGMKGAEIARKMKRTVGAIRTRKSHFKKKASKPVCAAVDLPICPPWGNVLAFAVWSKPRGLKAKR